MKSSAFLRGCRMALKFREISFGFISMADKVVVPSSRKEKGIKSRRTFLRYFPFRVFFRLWFEKRKFQALGLSLDEVICLGPNFVYNPLGFIEDRTVQIPNSIPTPFPKDIRGCFSLSMKKANPENPRMHFLNTSTKTLPLWRFIHNPSGINKPTGTKPPLQRSDRSFSLKCCSAAQDTMRKVHLPLNVKVLTKVWHGK